MRVLSMILLGVTLLVPCAGAQDDNIGTATSSLQEVLANLKESVAKLAVDNDQLAARDNAVRQQVSQLQMQLEQLRSQGEQYDRSIAQLKGDNPRRAAQIADLERENVELDNRTQHAVDGIKGAQDTLDAAGQAYQQLLGELGGAAGLPSSLGMPSPEFMADEARQKERLKLMKMIYDSQQRQEALQQTIAELQKNPPTASAVDVLAQQQTLKAEVKALEDQIASYAAVQPAASGVSPDQWSDAQLGQLEMELKNLEANYSQLKDLMEQVGRKSLNARMSSGQQLEEERLQANIDELSRQGVSLRSDLDDLMSQMVELDKRKSRLEMMLKQLP